MSDSRPTSRNKVIHIPETFDTWASLIDDTDLTNIQKHAIKTRIISVVMRLRARLRRLSVAYTCLRTTTTVGSLLVPSILTLQSPTQPVTQPTDGFSAYWAIWGIGLVVSVSNAFVSLFRVDKNYYTIGNLLEKIESESWLFLTQSGPYNPENDEEGGHNITDDSTYTGHRMHFRQFIEKCEILINRAVRSEYATGFKPNGSHTAGGSSTAGVVAARTNTDMPYLREAPPAAAGLYHPEPPSLFLNRREIREPTDASNVPNPVDVTRRPSPSQPSSHRGGHPISSVSRTDVQDHDAASDSTAE
jgi:hypothetical protein